MSVLVAFQLTTIVALVSAPRISAFVAQNRLTGAANQLAFDIVRVRMQSVGHNRFVRVRVVNGGQYTRETSSDGNTWSNPVTTSLPSGVTLTPTAAEVRFDRRGFATVTDTITLTSSIQKVKTVATNVVGRVTIT